MKGPLTPWLDIQSDNGLGSGLDLALLLLAVLGQTLLADTGGLGILLLVVRAKQVNVVVVLGSSRGLGGVQGELRGIGAVGGVRLGGVARKSGKLGLVGLDVLVPASGIGVLAGIGGGGEGLEDGNIGLGRVVPLGGVSRGAFYFDNKNEQATSEVPCRAGFVFICRS